MTFDVETEAQLHDPPQVRTYVFLDGRIVDRVVWEFQANDSNATTRLVSLQHESVVKQINTRMVNGMPEDDPRVIGTLPPPEPTAAQTPSDRRLLGSVRPVELAGVDVAPPEALPKADGLPRSLAPLVPPPSSVPADAASNPDPRVPFAEGAVIDEEATPIVEVGARSSEMANLAFLATGLDALLSRHFTLGACEHIAVESRDGTVLVAREGGLTAAFAAGRRGSPARAVAEVRRALAKLEEDT